MKKAKEYMEEFWKSRISPENTMNIVDLIKKVQEEAIRETVKECAENALLLLEPVNGEPYTDKNIFTYATLVSPDKNSILSIADKLIKEL